MQAVYINSDNELRGEVLEIIREMPGLTSTEIATLLPHRNKITVATTVFRLKNEGIVETTDKKAIVGKDGKPKSVPIYTLSANPTPNVVKMKRKAPTEAALHIQIKQLTTQIAELEAWNRDAIARYPDLAVAPTILKARKLVAEEVRAGGDHGLAEQIMAGSKDTTLMVRVAIKALEEGE